MKIFSFVKKVFVLGLTILSSIANALECVSMNNQACIVRRKTININNNNPIFNSFNVKINRCSGNCNIINDPYATMCVPDTEKNLNVTVFNLMSRTNETRSIECHETCKCIWRLNEIICNNKQRWNKDECRCEWKELIDKGVCDKEFIFNPSNCKWENNNKTKLANITIGENENSHCNSRKVYIGLMIVAIVISTRVTIYFVYYNWFLIKNNIICTKCNLHKETLIY